MRVVFVTHNDLGFACLEELVDLGADVRAVYTRPSREDLADQTDFGPLADRHGFPLHRVDSVNADQVKSQIRELRPELLFVVGWSQLVKTEVIEAASEASLGMHPAPLPRGRGRAPLAWSLIKGLDRTDLTLFHLAEEADAGDIVGQEPLPIDVEDDAASLYGKMVEAGRQLIRRYYPRFEEGTSPRVPQDDSEATWWPKRSPRHGLVDWTRPPHEVYDWIRGQTRPYPGAFSYLDDRKITIWGANPPCEERAFVRPGEITYREGEVLGVGAWEGIVELTEVQVAGDEPVPAGRITSDYEFDVGDSFVDARDALP